MKGIAPLISTILLIIITISGATITYTFTSDFIGSNLFSPSMIMPLIIVESVELKNYGVASINVRNLGTTTSIIDKVYMISILDGSIVGDYSPRYLEISPGQLTKINIEPSSLIASKDGNYYLKVVTKEGWIGFSKAFFLKGLDFGEWVEYSGNPVLDPYIRAYYPCVIYDVNGFHGHGVSAKYKMWFNSYYSNRYSIWFAFSNDGITWNLHNSPVSGLSDNSGHPWVLYFSEGFPGSNSGNNPNGTTMYYRIWYWDANKLYTVEAIRYAESPDGINWYNDQPVKNGLIPIITGSSSDWNKGSYGPACVLYNPSASNSGTDWKFRMYYDGTPGHNESIGVGFSSDGITWIGYDKNGDGKADPVLTGSSFGWDANYVYPCTVLKLGSKYYMFFSGGVSGTNEGIGYAISDDGLTWTKDPKNPIFHKNDGVSWRNARTYTPAVVKAEDGLRMYFTGVDSMGNYAIGYAMLK
ncbi:MAG: hypothetical protein NZ922_04015 [Candidatus Methanomethyliaceae archaeon]|nr:hypothetical protein [Candidatus Methanomethyliaceae archaeon]MDW7970642.1 hypothetical protein [Nitrososphaerota archaeon]